MHTNVNFPGQECASAQYDLTTFNNLTCVYQESAEKASIDSGRKIPSLMPAIVAQTFLLETGSWAGGKVWFKTKSNTLPERT